MDRRTIVITGASDGIGAAAARQLSHRGHEVVVVGRSPERTRAVARELGADHLIADFTRLDDVRALAEALRSRYRRIDVLANNAGGIMGARELTADGFEKTFQVDHLAPFLLTMLLLPTLLASRAAVLQTSSTAAARYGMLDTTDLQHEHGYSPTRAYGDAKLANILFTRELHRRHHDQGLSAAAFHPGIVGTSFARDTTHVLRLVYHMPLIRQLVTVSPRAGAAELVWLAEGTPGRTWASGEYYERKKVAPTTPQAYDAELAHELWDASEALLADVR